MQSDVIMLLYPLKGTALFFLLFITTITWVAHIHTIMLLVQISMYTLSTLSFAKYLFEVIDHSFAGHDKPPDFDTRLVHPFNQWRHVHLVFGLGLLSWPALELAKSGQETAFWLYHLVSFAVMPAYVALLSAGNSIFSPLNPFKWARFIITAAGGYWLMLLILFAIMSLAEYLFTQEQPFIAIFLYLYSLILGFHWLGKLMREHRFELDILPDDNAQWDEQREQIALDKIRRFCLQRIHEQQLLNNVVAVIDTHITQHEKEPLTAHRWFHERLMQWENKQPAKLHAQQYIKVLQAAGKTAAAQMLREQMEENQDRFIGR